MGTVKYRKMEKSITNKVKALEEELMLYPTIEIEIHKLTRELKNIRQGKDELISCSTSNLNGMPRNNSLPNPEYFKYEKQLENFDYLIKSTHEEIERLNNIKIKINNILSNLPEREQKIIRLRYFLGKQWAMIDKEMNYTRDYSRKIIDRAILQIIRKSEEEVRFFSKE